MASLCFIQISPDSPDQPVLIRFTATLLLLNDVFATSILLRWDEAFQVLEKRTAVPSGPILI